MAIERQAARFLADVADVVSKIDTGKTSYGEFYISEVRIGFEGDDTGLRVVPNEYGDYDITEVDPEPVKRQ